MRVATWNVAAINNNPFEYWASHPDPEYTRVMQAVERFVVEPGADDIPVNHVFTDAMFDALKARMASEGWAGLDVTEARWRADLRERTVVSGFLTDGTLGKKRLASMPDRFTNTIVCADGKSVPRPSVINSFTEELRDMAAWWSRWLSFMFDEPLPIPTKDGSAASKRPVELLVPIKRAKYPDVTEEEEAASLPLQTVCLAIFDAVLLHLMSTVAPTTWQPLKKELVDALVTRKQERTLEIIRSHFHSTDVLCVQEASTELARAIEEQVAPGRFVVVPSSADPTRGQNSLLVLSAATFDKSSVAELTQPVLDKLAAAGHAGALAAGDLLAVTVCAEGQPSEQFLLASFHGDTNGLQTAPVVTALHAQCAAASAEGGRLRLIAGIDANTYLDPDGTVAKAGKFYSVVKFTQDLRELGLRTCWSPSVPWSDCITTYNARTHLQPQLNKACRFREISLKGDINPKVRGARPPRERRVPRGATGRIARARRA